MRLAAPSDLRELPFLRGLLQEEWLAIRRAAEARVERARQAVVAAQARVAKERGGSFARTNLDRTHDALRRARRLHLGVTMLRRLAAREREVLSIQLERVEWLPDGSCAMLLPGKAAARRPDEILAGEAMQARPRTGMLLQEDAALLRGWLIDESPTQQVPTRGPLWNAGGPRPLLTEDVLAHGLHRLALEAGVQAYVPGGRSKRTHRFFITPHTLREFAEREAIPKVGAETAARVVGHSPRVQKAHYWLVGLDEARAFARAQGP